MLRVEDLPDARIAYKTTGAETIAYDSRSGEVANTYVRHKSPLDIWYGKDTPGEGKKGLRGLEYAAGLRYGALWREVCQPRSPAHSDTTRIIVDGGGSPPDMVAWRGNGELAAAQQEIADEETITFLNRLCGMEDWPEGDKRRFKRKCRKGLEALARLWRRR